MWWTSCGERVLEGAEGALFRECLACFVDDLCTLPDDDCPVGIRTFDSLTLAQKVALLAVIGHALLRRDVPIPELTADSEAAVAAVFRYLRGMVALELAEPELGQEWRTRIIDACKDCEAEELPAPSCAGHEEWDLCICSLEDRILWDADWETDVDLDADPEISAANRILFGITNDYYTAIVPDPPNEDVERLRAAVMDLCSTDDDDAGTRT